MPCKQFVNLKPIQNNKSNKTSYTQLAELPKQINNINMAVWVPLVSVLSGIYKYVHCL